MNGFTESTANLAATSSARRPKSLEDLLEIEEQRAIRGITAEAQNLGGDLRDALNLRRHFQRRPVQTAGVIAGAIGFLVALRRGAGRRRTGGGGGLKRLLWSLARTTVVGAAVNRFRNV